MLIQVALLFLIPAIQAGVRQSGPNPDANGILEVPSFCNPHYISQKCIDAIDKQPDDPTASVGDTSSAKIDDPTVNAPEGDDRNVVFKWKQTPPGKTLAFGRKLRILPVGDSITGGYGSNWDGGDGKGYRLQLKDDLSRNDVVFAGTEKEKLGSMSGGYFAAWSGKTIQYINDNIDRSLDQRPNIVLVAAGTNDMNADGRISTEGNDPVQAIERLGKLIDKIVHRCPDATVLVAMILSTCDPNQVVSTQAFQQLILSLVLEFSTGSLRDCIHPTNKGYKIMGDMWYDFMTQIPSDWIQDPIGNDPVRDPKDEDMNRNGGLDQDFPPPNWQTPPMERIGMQSTLNIYSDARRPGICPIAPTNSRIRERPAYSWIGKIALDGVGRSGDWKYNKNWQYASQVAEGLGWGNDGVRLHDMNGDGKADYVWIHPQTGEIRCWLNNLPNRWSPAGNNNSVIGSGVGPAKNIFLADMNGDGLADYLVVDPNKGSVKVWWNWGPDPNWVNGWKFEAGGEIASGVPHANSATLRFPDINGDGRADYVVIGQGGALKCFINLGTVAGNDPIFHYQGTIASGAESDISKIVFADMNGDGRDDYLIWDNDGGLSGFLNKPGGRGEVPIYIDQGGSKQIADGVHQPPGSLRLADMDGDGKDDYIYVADNGALVVWYNRGATDDSLAMNGLRFASLQGYGRDDYIWLDPKTGAPTVYFNMGPNEGDALGWYWKAQNQGNPIAAGAAPSHEVQFGDIDGDGLDDYLVVDSKSGALTAYAFLPDVVGEDRYGKFAFKSLGVIASGLGPGKNVRLVDIDIDGDGRVDYVYLNKKGGATVYLNRYYPGKDLKKLYTATPQADASGIGQRPEEISFHDIDGDGKADYLWTRPLDGQVIAWRNMYPEVPAWKPLGIIRPGDPANSHNVLWGKLTSSGRSHPIRVDVDTGAIGSWLSTCQGTPPPSRFKDSINIFKERYKGQTNRMAVRQDPGSEGYPNPCTDPNYDYWGDSTDPDMPGASDIIKWRVTGHDNCYYTGPKQQPGRIICSDGTYFQCIEHPQYGYSDKCNDIEVKMTAKLLCGGWARGTTLPQTNRIISTHGAKP